MDTKSEYLLLFRGPAWYEHASPEVLRQGFSEFQSWYNQLTMQGKLKAAQPLARQGAVVSGKSARVVIDGPYAEAKEAIGGYFLLAPCTFDEAIAIAKGFPGFEHGVAVEVRPIAEECPLTSRARQLESSRQLAAAA